MTGVHQPADVFRDVEMVDVSREHGYLPCAVPTPCTDDEAPFIRVLPTSDIGDISSESSDGKISDLSYPDSSDMETFDASPKRTAEDRRSYAQATVRDRPVETASSVSRNSERPSTSGPSRGSSSASNYANKHRKTQTPGWSPKGSFETSASGSQKSSSNGNLCVVCHKSPRYSKGGRSYPTCGLACASKLPAEKGKTMCQVCGDKPVAVRSNGEVQQTCGYTCSRELDSQLQSTSQKCEYCKEKPRAFSKTGQTFAHCGTACRDKSQSSTQVVKGKCKTCLVCWREDRRKLSDSHQFCSEECTRAAMLQAPTLIEVPRGHSHFYDISGQFEAEWDSNTQDRPTISRIYSIVPPEPVIERWIKFKGYMERQQRGRGVTETKLWIGATRRCDIGDSDIKRCEDPMCVLCDVLINGVVPQQPYGTHAFRNTNRADAIFAGKSTDPNQSRAMFLVDVVSNKEAEMSIEQFTSPPPTGSHGHNFVRIVKYSRLGFSQDTGELCLYIPDSMVPRYIVIYSQTV